MSKWLQVDNYTCTRIWQGRKKSFAGMHEDARGQCVPIGSSSTIANRAGKLSAQATVGHTKITSGNNNDKIRGRAFAR